MADINFIIDGDWVDDALVELNKFNPIANLSNGIWGLITGYDCYGKPSDNTQSVISIIGAIPVGKLGNISLNGIKSISFQTGHVTEHLIEIGLTSSKIEKTIFTNVGKDIQNASNVGSFWGRVSIEGQLIEYRGYNLGNGVLNIGTYYKVK